MLEHNNVFSLLERQANNFDALSTNVFIFGKEVIVGRKKNVFTLK